MPSKWAAIHKKQASPKPYVFYRAIIPTPRPDDLEVGFHLISLYEASPVSVAHPCRAIAVDVSGSQVAVVEALLYIDHHVLDALLLGAWAYQQYIAGIGHDVVLQS